MDHTTLLQAALAGLEAQRERIGSQIALVRAQLAGKSLKVALPASETPAKPKKEKPARKRRQLSDEARERIRAAQQKRWATARATKDGEIEN